MRFATLPWNRVVAIVVLAAVGLWVATGEFGRAASRPTPPRTNEAETAALLDSALLEARRRDAELEKVRREATFAGDADPYKKPRTEDDDA